MTTCYTTMDSPLGTLLLTSENGSLTGVEMLDRAPAAAADWTRDPEAPPLAEARRQLAAYFAGTRRDFDLPLAMRGTEFQRRVWEELRRIPYGTTISYGELARRVGNPRATRAVGMANNRNRLAIVVPCHRVIGANGRLVGYGGGLPRKETLLRLEARGDLEGAAVSTLSHR